jgi:hypothetical protein
MFSNGGHLGFFNHHEKKNSLPVIQHLTLTLDTVGLVMVMLMLTEIYSLFEVPILQLN